METVLDNNLYVLLVILIGDYSDFMPQLSLDSRSKTCPLPLVWPAGPQLRCNAAHQCPQSPTNPNMFSGTINRATS